MCSSASCLYQHCGSFCLHRMLTRRPSHPTLAMATPFGATILGRFGARQHARSFRTSTLRFMGLRHARTHTHAENARFLLRTRHAAWLPALPLWWAVLHGTRCCVRSRLRFRTRARTITLAYRAYRAASSHAARFAYTRHARYTRCAHLSARALSGGEYLSFSHSSSLSTFGDLIHTTLTLFSPPSAFTSHCD